MMARHHARGSTAQAAHHQRLGLRWSWSRWVLPVCLTTTVVLGAANAALASGEPTDSPPESAEASPHAATPAWFSFLGGKTWQAEEIAGIDVRHGFAPLTLQFDAAGQLHGEGACAAYTAEVRVEYAPEGAPEGEAGELPVHIGPLDVQPSSLAGTACDTNTEVLETAYLGLLPQMDTIVLVDLEHLLLESHDAGHHSPDSAAPVVISFGLVLAEQGALRQGL